MYVSRILGHVSRHEIHKALQFKDPLPRTPVKMYLLVSKSGLSKPPRRPISLARSTQNTRTRYTCTAVYDASAQLRVTRDPVPAPAHAKPGATRCHRAWSRYGMEEDAGEVGVSSRRVAWGPIAW